MRHARTIAGLVALCTAMAVPATAWAQRCGEELNSLDGTFAKYRDSEDILGARPDEISRFRELRESARALDEAGRDEACLDAVEAARNELEVLRRPSVVSASSLAGNTVKSMDDEEIGSIERVLVDLRHGAPPMAVVEFGGVLGLGEESKPLPLAKFRATPEESTVRVNLSQDMLRQAPTYDPEELESMGARRWLQSVLTYYGMQDTILAQHGNAGKQGEETGGKGTGQRSQRSGQQGSSSPEPAMVALETRIRELEDELEGLRNQAFGAATQTATDTSGDDTEGGASEPRSRASADTSRGDATDTGDAGGGNKGPGRAGDKDASAPKPSAPEQGSEDSQAMAQREQDSPRRDSGSADGAGETATAGSNSGTSQAAAQPGSDEGDAANPGDDAAAREDNGKQDETREREQQVASSESSADDTGSQAESAEAGSAPALASEGVANDKAASDSEESGTDARSGDAGSTESTNGKSTGAGGSTMDSDCKQARKNIFATLDTNGDGRLSEEEASHRFEVMAARSELDGNADGVIDSNEFQSYRPGGAKGCPETGKAINQDS